MRKITDLVHNELKWEQPNALKMEYQLRAGSEIAATLRFRSALGTYAVAQSGEGCWTFKRVGFFQTQVTIRPCNADTEIAVFKPKTWSGGGTLIFPNGPVYRANTNCWQNKLTFETETGIPLLTLKSGGVIHQSATVACEPQAAHDPHLPLMALLGWYLIVMMQSDVAVAFGAIATAG